MAKISTSPAKTHDISCHTYAFQPTSTFEGGEGILAIHMILCLNLNAAIDKTIILSSFELDQIHRPESVIALAGGKGCNVARALKTLRDMPVVSGWVGGFAGRFIETELQREGIQADFIYTDSESRTCTSILDRKRGTLTEIYETGEAIPPSKIEELKAKIQATIGNYQAVALSGSLPLGVPSTIYAEIIEIARKADVLTFLDTSGDALREGIKAGPFFVKPNEAEAKSLLGVQEADPLDSVKAAKNVSAKYKTNVLLSMGAKGAVAACGEGTFMVPSPRVKAISAVGSGDCTLGGLIHGIVHGLSLQESIASAVAAGAANTLTVGAGRFKLDDFERLRDQIQTQRI